MSLLTQFTNSLQYQLYKATYDPDAEQYAKDKVVSDQKAAEDAAAKKKADDEAAKAKAEAKPEEKDISGAICFGTPITLSKTNFFDDAKFKKYIGEYLGPGGKPGYMFGTLAEAQEGCKTKRDATGIISLLIDSGKAKMFFIYVSDPKLGHPLDMNSEFGRLVNDSNNTLQFIPIQPCVDPNDAGDEFSWKRLLGRVVSITFQIVILFLLIVVGLYGSSLATNLNIYREAPIRVLYAIYGFLFFWIVIPYSLIYRWWWKGKKPVFYAFIPLVPYKFNNHYAAMFLSWMSFKPDDQIACLMEWKKIK